MKDEGRIHESVVDAKFLVKVVIIEVSCMETYILPTFTRDQYERRRENSQIDQMLIINTPSNRFLEPV